jgi:prolyl oligopeptidase
LPDPAAVAVDPTTYRAELTGGREDTSFHLGVVTFTAPQRLLHHDLRTGETTPVTDLARTEEAAGDDDVTLVTEQVRVHHDGVAVPLFLVHRRDVTPDGGRPTVLWGYGGFSISVTPAFRPAWRAWVDAGGVLAVACLRGGGEYGRAWHDDGRLANKQHVFDDALACAAWLTGRRRDEVHATAITPGAQADVVWSAPHHLGVEGRSNGGLLAAACLTQAPEAFGSVVPEVGVLDMTRFHLFTIGWAWTSDYGDPDDPVDREVLLRYSPLHRLEPGRTYPPTLITTGDTDDRVVPSHSFRFAAALQAAQAGDAPILLRVDTSAGHGAGKPVSKLIDERADVLAFHAQHLGLSVGPAGVG